MPTDRQRRAAERRRLRRQLQRRAEREARRRRYLLLGTIVGTLAVIAIIVVVVVSSSNDHSTAAKHKRSRTPSPSTSPSTTAASYPCTWTPSGSPAKRVTVPATTTPPKSGTVDLLVQTSRGPMTFQLNRAAAPCAVESFVSLAEQNYFDSTPCHRLTTQGIFVLQCGDPTGTGSGGPGYRFADELTGHEQYVTGALAMANSGPNTNGSQFFIVYKKSTLDPKYTVFGKVTSGLSVVREVADRGSDNSNPAGGGKPKLPISITGVRVVQ